MYATTEYDGRLAAEAKGGRRSLIRLEHLYKRYPSPQGGGRTVLEDFSLELPERGAVCFFGPSGCGKTTLLHILAGLTRPDAGTVTGLEGKRLSMVFQEDRLLPWLTAAQNVALALPGTGALPKREELDAARSLLDQLGLAEAAELKPDQLSGGMQRRVAIARAFAHQGEVLVLDEPFKGLDGAVKDRVIRQTARMKEKALILFVTHDLPEAQALADRILRFSGPPLALEAQP